MSRVAPFTGAWIETKFFFKRRAGLARRSLHGSVNHYAHTRADEAGRSLPPEHWEPLFSTTCPALDGACCERCAVMQPGHGRLNTEFYPPFLVKRS